MTAAQAPAAASRPGDAGKPIACADGPRGDTRHHVVRDVERLDVPRVALLEPVGHAVDDDEQDHQLGRQQQRAGDDEDDRRVEDAPAVEVEREELRERRQHGKSREAAPVDGLDVVGRDDDPERRGRDDGSPVEPRRRSEPCDQRPAQPQGLAAGLDGCSAHGLVGSGKQLRRDVRTSRCTGRCVEKAFPDGGRSKSGSAGGADQHRRAVADSSGRD